MHSMHSIRNYEALNRLNLKLDIECWITSGPFLVNKTGLEIQYTAQKSNKVVARAHTNSLSVRGCELLT